MQIKIEVMKKLVVLLILLTGGSVCNIWGQTSNDWSAWENHMMMDRYRKTQQDISLTYDDNWNPIAKFSIQNISDKVIVGVEIRIWYAGYDEADIFQPTTIHRTNTLINPQERKLLIFDLTGVSGDPKSFTITRIRYSDGTLCK